MAKELGFNNGNSKNTKLIKKKKNSIMENGLIHDYKEHLPNHYGIKLNSKIEILI